MDIPNRVLNKITNTKLKLSDLNPHLMCVLCGGYYIDATTIVECLHSFCRSCIVKHLEGSKYCPICEVQVHKTKPLINIRPDKTLQDIVYKLVPGLFANEMQNRREFYQERPHYIKPPDLEAIGALPGEQGLFVSGENITFSLTYREGPSPIPLEERFKEYNCLQVMTELRYFRCPTGVSIQHLKKLLKAKYELRGANFRVEIFYKDESLHDEYTLLDVSYIYFWRTKDNLSLTYKIWEGQTRRRRRRYFGGVDELPAHFTPLSILQSRLGLLAENLPSELTDGRRHLRSDIEKKRKEIEMKMLEERRLSERELRSHDEKKKEKEKEKDKDNKNEGKKKEKDEKKKDKDGKNQDGKEKKKDGKNGEDKKDEKKKKKEGKCQDEKKKEKDDEDDDEDGKDKDAKDERNGEKKEVSNKRKREDDYEEKRKREKREEVKENHVEEKEMAELKEVSGEATNTSASDLASAPASTGTQAPATTSNSALDSAQTSTSADEGSAPAATTETASDSASEQTSTTATENEQKTDEADMKEEESSTSTGDNKATPPQDNESIEIQLQISESGVMSTSPVVENSGDVVKTVEERVCGRVTRRSSITGATLRDEGLGARQTRKRGRGRKSDGGPPKKSNRKVSQKAPKTFKTITRSPKVWNPTISKEKLRGAFSKNSTEPKKPAKFFKLRNRLRSENDSNEAKVGCGDPALEQVEEEEELPRHEIEKEEALVEPQAAQVAPRDEGEEKRMEEEKRRFEEDKRQNEEDKRRSEENNKMETKATNANTAFKGDPKTFGPLDKEDKYSMIVGASAPDLPSNLKEDPKTFGHYDTENRCSTMMGARAPNLPSNLAGDPKTFGPLDKEDKCSTIVGANAPELPTNLKGDPKTFGPLEKEDKCSMIVGASAPNVPSNPKEDAKIYEALDEEDNCSMIIGASAPDLPTNLKADPKTFGVLDMNGGCAAIVGASAPELPTNMRGGFKAFGVVDNNMFGASAPNLPTNLRGDYKNFGSYDKEDRYSNIIGASAPNLLTNPFIPNSNHFLFSDVTLPTDSGNFSKSAEAKLDKSLLANVIPGAGVGISGIGGAGFGMGEFKNPVASGGGYSPMCFLDPSRLVYPYQAYPIPEANPLLGASHLSPFGNMTGFGPISGFHASLPPCINNLSSPHQNVHVVSLVSANKNKDDGTNEGMKGYEGGLNLNKMENKERRKRRKPPETAVTNLLKGKKNTFGFDEEGDEDDEKIFVPAKRKRDEKGSWEKAKDDINPEKGDRNLGDEGSA